MRLIVSRSIAFRRLSDGFRTFSDVFGWLSDVFGRLSDVFGRLSEVFGWFSRVFGWLLAIVDGFSLIWTAFRYRERRFADRPYPFFFSFFFWARSAQKKMHETKTGAWWTREAPWPPKKRFDAVLINPYIVKITPPIAK